MSDHDESAAPRWVTLHEASHLSSVNEKTLRRWIHAGKLRPETDRHGRYLVNANELPEREHEPEATPTDELAALRRRVAELERRLVDVEARQRMGAQHRSPAPAIDDSQYLQPPESPLSANPVQRRARSDQRASSNPLPDGWRPAIEFVREHGIKDTTTRRWMLEGKLPAPHTGEWAAGGPGTFTVKSAYDEEQQREVVERIRKLRPGMS